MLYTPGDNKVAVIKLVREITGTELAEAKQMVDGAPSTIKKSVLKNQAYEMANKLNEMGCDIYLIAKD